MCVISYFFAFLIAINPPTPPPTLAAMITTNRLMERTKFDVDMPQTPLLGFSGLNLDSESA